MNELLRKLLYLPPQASTYARGVDLLHFCVITSTMLGATFVFLLALFYLVRYRRRTAGELTPHTRTPARVEIFIIASLQLLFLVFWLVGAVQYNRITTAPNDALPVYVTAKQFMWKFAYPDGRSSLDVLTVPVRRKIKLVMTSRDVIHSLYVPAFRLKYDVVPGRYHTAWFEASLTGSFDIDCAEYCGTNHSLMHGEVRVLSEIDYARWLEGRPVAARPGGPDALSGREPGARPGEPDALPGSDLAEEGRSVAARRGCLNCHSLDGQPHIGPTWAALFGSSVKLTTGVTVVADEGYLTRSMMDPQFEIVDGYRPVMPTYRGVLAQPEVAALVEFIKALRDAPEPSGISLPRVVPEGVGMPQEPTP